MHDGVVGNDFVTIAQELAEVSRLVDGDDVNGALDRFVARVVATVKGCDHVLIVAQDDDRPELLAAAGGLATSDTGLGQVAVFDAMAERRGPLRDVLQHGEPHRLSDAGTDRRWPTFSAAMIAAGFRSCLLLPLPARTGPGAAFCLFSARPDNFGEESFDVVLLFTLNAGVVFDNAQLYHDSQSLIGQLQTALTTRSLVGRAQGIVMHRYDLDTDSAAALIKRGSQNTNTKLRDVARAIVEAQEQGSVDVALTKYEVTRPG
jgi:GAF domain-containing protein